ncbi:hypothetical protein PG614_03730 [Riemerella anatipestifer]|nr:hypothetical protein [Riemerella anatipestifer]MDY3532394.1 hypothetical protein [Riemerella anatipestifer]MDY3535051.1 hypothetical protein [Riemerella anatipestifer]
MTPENNFIEIFKCKYLVNSEYLKDILSENKIEALINYENNGILVKNSDIKVALEIISTQDIDESETIDQENFMTEYKEWNDNNLNPGHYLGGNIPFFIKTRSNHLFFGVATLGFFILQAVTLIYYSNFSFWNIIFTILTFLSGVNFMISWFNYQNEKKRKKNNK